MNLFQTIILSIVEGITEFLPISSTGHLILAGSLLNIPRTTFVSSFEIFIQLGAILGIVLLYGKTLFVQKQKIIPIITAFIPTAIVGFVLYKIVKHLFLGNPWIVVISLIIGGLVLIFFDLYFESKNESTPIVGLTLFRATGIGFFQTVSIIPGVSRSAATIIGGQLMGLSKKDAVEFSFLLAVPTMAAATSLDLIKSNAFSFSGYEWLLMGLGSLMSCLTAMVAVKLFVHVIQKKNTFLWFGVYRIAIALLYTAIVIH